MEDRKSENIIPLPWWTWGAPLIIIETGDLISFYFFQDSITSSFYLPTALGLILVFWWGPLRVIPAVFLISIFNNILYGFSSYWIWLGFGLGDSFAILLSWFLFEKIVKGKYWLPDSRTTALFVIFGLTIPIFFYSANWQVMYILSGKMKWVDFFVQYRRDLLSESIVNTVIVIPVLYFLTPILSNKRLIKVNSIPSTSFEFLKRKQIPEILSIALLIMCIVVLFNFQNFWFLLGAVSLYVAMRFGFDLVLLANILIFVFTYLIPSVSHPIFISGQEGRENAQAFFGYLLLFLFSSMTGRVISDLWAIEKQLHSQNQELKQTNQELDRFVYSASHDMSAPLKSIRGLVNVGRMTRSIDEQIFYFNKIEVSALRLENFIEEVLDYSRNNRTEIINEIVSLKKLCEEIFNGLRHLDDVNAPTLQLDETTDCLIFTDRSRLKIILNNILSNAIKYQKKSPDHRPVISVSTRTKLESNFLEIFIEDNGEGIPEEVLPNIFKMFFRGNLKSTGSGLGLYISKEAAGRIGGDVNVQSEIGKGTIFTIELPLPKEDNND
jgi:signal transduction histidine kinase